ncbi:MAG: head decoration protein [Magnetococcales bacterium]|nr:head decoration protein [Magnetococcales bacterium]
MSGMLGTTTYNDFSQENLLADEDYLLAPITLASGGGALTRGAVLGQLRLAISTPATGINTGNGTLGTVTLSPQAQLGTYTLRCTATATHAGTFAVIAPDGSTLASATVDVAYAGPQLNFTLAHGATDFAVGDTFTIPVIPGSGKYLPIAFAAGDGTQLPRAVLAEDADATSADAAAIAYITGALRQSGLVWPTGATTAQKTQCLWQLRDVALVTV